MLQHPLNETFDELEARHFIALVLQLKY